MNLQYLVDVEEKAMDEYATALKKDGWQAHATHMGGKGGMLNAQKGALAITLALSLAEKGGTLMVYEIPGK